MYRVNKWLGILLFVLALVVGLVSYESYTERKKHEQELLIESEKINAQLRTLRKEREKLNSELNELYNELYVGDMGSTIVLLTDTHSDCLDDAVSMLDRYNYKGVIVLSYPYLPENELKGYLNREQIDSLVEQGYELVIKAENEDLTVTYNKFKEYGYDIKGFYFDGIVVTSLMVDEIRSLDENMVVIGNYLDSVGVSDTLLINYLGSRSQNVKSNYDAAISKSQVVALTVGYENSSSRYDEVNFKSMLETIRDYIYKDETALCSISEAIVRNQEYRNALAEIDAEKYTRVEEIRKRIAQIDASLMDMDF